MMNKLISALMISFVGFSAHATIDSNTEVFLVVEHIQSGEFLVQAAPMIGCYGLAKGPQLVQFTAEYKAPSNIGCGGEKFLDNINALTCATITDSVESDDYSGFASVTLDIAKCTHKNNPDFIQAVEKAARLNFAPEKVSQFQLKLVK